MPSDQINTHYPLGFSLLELIIGLIILSILTMISYPTYARHLIKTHRAQAKTALVSAAAQLEHYYVVHHSYRGANLANSNNIMTNRYYRIEITTANDQHYELRAIPVGSQIKDDFCGIFSIDEQGNKKISGSGDYQDCW